MSNQATLEQLAEALNKSFANPMADPRLPASLQKSTFSQSGSATTGLTFYDLEAGAKLLYPVLTPLRNEIPRVSGKGGIQANWKAITKINATGIRIGVSGGNRGGVIAVTTAEYNAVYKGIGLESNVDFEAGYAAQGFDDVRAIAAKSGLESLMLGEELILLGGNGSLALGTTPTPSLAGATTGGTLSDGAVRVICVALTLEGVSYSSLTSGVPGMLTRVNADGSSDTFGGGSAQQSAAQSITLAGGGSAQKITATVTAVNGAVGYAWYFGASGSERLNQITSSNKAVITAVSDGGAQLASALPASDNSVNNLIFDGLITQALKPGSGAYVKQMNGTSLTADGNGGVVEIDAALKSMWDVNRLTPDCIWVSSTEAKSISDIILQGSSTSNLRFTVDVKDGMLAGGKMVREYLNRFSMAGGQVIPIRLHPNLPAGTILMTTAKLPYPLANVPNVIRVVTRQEYYQIEWPLRSRKYEYGVYADEVLQHYFPPSMAVITGIV